MIEIIYRIYEVCEPQENQSEYYFVDNGKKIISQEVLICENRKHFKEIIKDLYSGEDIKFKSSNNYLIGQKYCIIISESCNNTESYLTSIKCVCGTCGVEFQTISKYVYCIDEYTIKNRLNSNFDKYEKLKFCSIKCKNKGIEIAIRENISTDYIDEWITPDNLFSNNGGYIYKITKRSTGEFYIGQSIHIPVFRWGQHLKTSRFPLSEIEDYIFEVIDSIDDVRQLNDREKYWIQTLYNQNPQKSLNIRLI